MMPLEEQLATGMREHTADVVPDLGILDRAARANRHRRTRHAAIGSGAAVVVVLAAVFGLTRTPHEPPTPATSPSASASPSPSTQAEVLGKALDALSSGDIEHVLITRAYKDDLTKEEVWFDPVANNMRDSETVTLKGEHRTELWHVEKGNIHIRVDHTARTWSSGRGGDPLTTKLPFMPTALRLKFSGNDFGLAGREAIDGRPAYRLTQTSKDWVYDIWVDADTFQVRRLKIDHLGSDYITTMDIEWLPRTPDVLQHLEWSPPAGYRHVRDS
jgi:hypothetical protein